MGDDDRILDEPQKLREDLTDEPDLVSTTPQEAYDLWEQQLDEMSASTKQSCWYRVKPFLEFLDAQDIDDLAALTPRHIKEFEAQRRSGERNQQTLNNQFGTLKLFLKYCTELDAVRKDVVEAVNVPELTADGRVNTEKLIKERATRILEELDQFRYASRDHVLVLLLWRTTMRIGAIHSLDLEDLYFTSEDIDRIRLRLREEGGHEPAVIDEIIDESEPPFILPQHWPETDTPLKNGEAGERVINVADYVAETIQDYIRVNRADVVDEHDRRPLLTSKKGPVDSPSRPSGPRSTFSRSPASSAAPAPMIAIQSRARRGNTAAARSVRVQRAPTRFGPVPSRGTGTAAGQSTTSPRKRTPPRS